MIDKLKKNWHLIVPAILGAGMIVIFGTMVTPTHEGKAPVVEKVDTGQEENNGTELQVQALLKRMAGVEENIKKIYKNQVELNRSITDLLDAETKQRKTDKDNRAYIAMIYNKVLSLELQVQSLGGGFNVRTKPKEEEINPLVGTDELPR